MNPKIETTDVLGDGILVGFDDGSNTFFSEDFLLQNRAANGNRSLSTEQELAAEEQAENDELA